jgi:hypothetical protein
MLVSLAAADGHVDPNALDSAQGCQRTTSASWGFTFVRLGMPYVLTDFALRYGHTVHDLETLS